MVRGRSLLSLLLGSSIPYFVEISLSSSPRMGNLTSSCRQHGHMVSTRAGSTAVTASMAVEQMSAGEGCKLLSNSCSAGSGDSLEAQGKQWGRWQEPGDSHPQAAQLPEAVPKMKRLGEQQHYKI